MEITVRKHRLGMDGAGYVLAKVGKRAKSEGEYLCEYAYYATLEAAAKAMLERLMGDKLKSTNVDVVSVFDLIKAVSTAKDELVAALREGVKE